MHLTPYLVLVIAGFGAFMAALGYAWARGALDERRVTRAAAAAAAATVRADPSAGRPRRAA